VYFIIRTHLAYLLLQFIYLVNLTDVQKFASVLKDGVTLTKPIKARSLYNATRAAGTEETKAQKPVKKLSSLDSSLAKVSRHR
jgi:hypothetical protein